MLYLSDYIPALRYGAQIDLVPSSPVLATDEWNGLTIIATPVSTYKSGNITYSSGRGSAGIKIDNTFSQVSGSLMGIFSRITTTGIFTDSADGCIGIKSVVFNSAALTGGSLYGGQFIVKKTGATTALASSSHIGIEAWFYETDSGILRTGIGGNFGYHIDSTAAAHGAGSVHRGIQIFCDNGGTSAATESTGLCIWNMAGTQDNAINIVNSGSGFTNFVKFTDDGAPAQSTASTVSAIGTKGWIKVLVGSATRYIGLSETVS